MKRLLNLMILIVTVLSITVTASYKAYSYDYCKLICEEDDWETQIIVRDVIVNGCVWTFKYMKRVADCVEPPMCDFRIVQLRPQNQTCASNADYHAVFIAASILMLESETTDCDPKLGECGNNFSVSYASCWHYDGPFPVPGGGTMPNLVACDETQCCRDLYLVCVDLAGNKTATLMSYDGYPNCSPGSGCFTVCE